MRSEIRGGLFMKMINFLEKVLAKMIYGYSFTVANSTGKYFFYQEELPKCVSDLKINV